jgi:hypothetical protein
VIDDDFIDLCPSQLTQNATQSTAVLTDELILSCQFAKLYSLAVKRLYSGTFSRLHGKGLQDALTWLDNVLDEWKSFRSKKTIQDPDYIQTNQTQDLSGTKEIDSRQQIFISLRYHELIFVMHQKYVYPFPVF